MRMVCVCMNVQLCMSDVGDDECMSVVGECMSVVDEFA
jgi:hypothetical protein